VEIRSERDVDRQLGRGVFRQTTVHHGGRGDSADHRAAAAGGQFAGGKQIFVGTGKFNETADKTNKDLQAFYSVWDADGGSGQLTVSSLQAQAVTGVFSGSTGQFITTSQNDTTYPGRRAGICLWCTTMC
jgi:hypothetical protein